MRLPSPLSFALLAVSLLGFGCDRLGELTERFKGSASSADGIELELRAIAELRDSGGCAQALPRIDALIASSPDVPETHYFRGLCLLDEAASEDVGEELSPTEEAAFGAFAQAIALNPRHALANVGVGDLHGRHVTSRAHEDGGEDAVDSFSIALHAYRRAVTIDPTLAEAQLHYGRFLARTGSIEAAEVAYQEAVAAAATVPEIAPDYYLAYGQFLAGPAERLDDAQDQFELARMFRQDDPAIQQELAMIQARIGLAHYKRQEFLLAQTILQEAVPMFPDSSIPEAQEAQEALDRLNSMRRR